MVAEGWPVDRQDPVPDFKRRAWRYQTPTSVFRLLLVGVIHTTLGVTHVAKISETQRLLD